jgi:hypothetical protein
MRIIKEKLGNVGALHHGENVLAIISKISPRSREVVEEN